MILVFVLIKYGNFTGDMKNWVISFFLKYITLMLKNWVLSFLDEDEVKVEFRACDSSYKNFLFCYC